MSSNRKQVAKDDDMREEYDFSHAVQGKYAHRFPKDVVMVTLAPDVAAAFPDVLLIPEHSNLRYHSFSAPFRELRQGYVSTPPAVHAAYPKAFTVIYTADGPLDMYHKLLQAAVTRGDDLMYRTWYADPQNEKVKSLMKR